MMDGPSITENAKQFDGKRETVNAQQEKVCTKSKNGCSKLPEPFKGYVETFVAGLYINTFMYLPFIFWFLNGILFVSEKKCDCSSFEIAFLMDFIFSDQWGLYWKDYIFTTTSLYFVATQIERIDSSWHWVCKMCHIQSV